ncbi:MAG: hypothetical protein QM784_14380 [Polyangiaceae bacterium]
MQDRSPSLPYPVLRGDLGPKPRGPASTALLAMTALLFVMRAARSLGRYALGFRSPASLALSEQGLVLSSRMEFLGRVLHERTQLVPLGEIRQMVREVRYPRLGLYAGLSALTLGTVIGARLFVDGLRVAGFSFAMMAWGALLVLLGIGLDLLLAGFSDSVHGKCRLIVSTRKSGAFALGSLEPAEVDALLAALMD